MDGGRSVLPVSKKARALLALAAAQAPQPLRREFAAGLLWSGKPREHAANSFRQALRELQIALAACGQPPLLHATTGRIALAPEAIWVDIHDPTAIRWKQEAEGAAGPLLLCQNLQGLDPAFDAYLERMWKNLVFQSAFVSPPPDLVARPGPVVPVVDGRSPGAAPAGVSQTPVVLPESADMPRPPVRPEDMGPGQGWRIAVLPFRSLGPQVDSSLSLSMAEEVSAALSRFRMPRVISTASFWDGDGPAADALARSRTYNLDYVISGTIQASGSRVRVTLTLLDVGMEFEVIWASRFEGRTDDLFALQDTLASQTVAQIDPELLQRHQFRGESARTPNAAAHQAVLTAIQGIYRPDRARFLQARSLLEHAIELDGSYAAAHAWLAYWCIMGIGQGWVDDPAEVSRRASTAADQAVALDPLDARGVSIAGHVKAYLLHDLEGALKLHQRAVALNPNLPIAWTLSSFSRLYNGEHETAIEHANVALGLSPSDPHVFFVEHAAMMAYLFLGEYQKAEDLAVSVLDRKPAHASALKVRLSILGYLGRSADAAACLKLLRSVEPTVSVRSIVTRPPLRDEDRAIYAKGLNLGGLEGWY